MVRSLNAEIASGIMQALCLESCMIMNAVSDTVLKLDTTEHRPNVLLAQIRKFQMHRKSLQAACSKMYPSEITESVRDEIHSNFITTFCNLIALLAHQLCKLTPQMVSDGNSSRNFNIVCRSSSMSPLVSIFWVLWDILFVSCEAVEKWSASWPSGTNTAQIHFYLHGLTDWLLTAGRQDPQAWAFLSVRDEKTGKRPAHILIMPQMHCLFSLSTQSSQNISHTLAQLPDNYLSTVCAFTCEQLTDVPHSPLAAFDKGKDPTALLHLASGISNIHHDADSSVLDKLAFPSVLEVVMRALAYIQHKKADDLGGLGVHSVMFMLHSLLPPRRRAADQTTFAASDRPNTTGSLPSAQSLTLLPSAMTPEHRIVSLILQRTNDTPVLTEFSHATIQSFFVRWIILGTTHEEKVSSMTVLAHYCLTRSLAFMQASREPASVKCMLPAEDKLQEQWKRQNQQHKQQLLEQHESPSAREERAFDELKYFLSIMQKTQSTAKAMVAHAHDGELDWLGLRVECVTYLYGWIITD